MSKAVTCVWRGVYVRIIISMQLVTRHFSVSKHDVEFKRRLLENLAAFSEMLL